MLATKYGDNWIIPSSLVHDRKQLYVFCIKSLSIISFALHTNMLFNAKSLNITYFYLKSLKTKQCGVLITS